MDEEQRKKRAEVRQQLIGQLKETSTDDLEALSRFMDDFRSPEPNWGHHPGSAVSLSPENGAGILVGSDDLE